MPRKQYKYHFIYKTTCLINKKFYYGMHSTSNLEDGYIGSGTRLWHSINKHGRENFKIEILEFLPDRKALTAREKELITEEMLQDPMCMNLKPGGDGGFCNEEHALKFHKAGGLATQKIRCIKHLEKLKDEEYYYNWKLNCKNGLLNYYKNHNNAFKGCKHSDESKLKMSIAGRGKNNSQFGTCWINNNIENKKIKKDELEYYLSLNWIKGRINIFKERLVYVNKDGLNKCIKESELASYILLDWKKGRKNK